MDLGSEITLTVAGRPYRLGKFGLKCLRAWVAWARQQIGDPFTDYRRLKGTLSKAHFEDWFKEAQRLRHAAGGLSDPRTKALLESPDGIAEALALALAKHHPDLTREARLAVIEDAFEEHGFKPVARLLKRIMGSTPPGELDAKRAFFRGDGQAPAVAPADRA